MPENDTTAPMSVRPSLSAAISRAASKSSCWIRMVTGAFMSRSTAGHRRGESDAALARGDSIPLDMGVFDCGADHLGLLERVGIGFAACGEPADQIVDSAHGGRRIDGL